MAILKKLVGVGILLLCAGLLVAIYTQGGPFTGGPNSTGQANLYFSSDNTTSISTAISKRPSDVFTVRPFLDLGSGAKQLLGRDQSNASVPVELAGYQLSVTYDPTVVQLLNPSLPSGIGNWQPLNGSGNKQLPSGDQIMIAIDPNNPLILFAGTSTHGIFKTTDGGLTWNVILLPGTVLPGTPAQQANGVVALAVDKTNSNNVYAALRNDHGFIRSQDGGQTWTTANAGLSDCSGGCPVMTFLIDPNNPNVLYLGKAGGFFLGTVAGPTVTWVAPTSQPANNILHQLAVDSSSTVYAGTDSGVFQLTNASNVSSVWQSFSTGLPAASEILDGLIIGPGGLPVATVYTGSPAVGQGIFRATTASGGGAWVSANNGLGAFTNAQALLYDPSANLLYTAAADNSNNNKIFQTSGASINWTDISQGYTQGAASLLRDPVTSGKLYAVSDTGNVFVRLDPASSCSQGAFNPTFAGVTPPFNNCIAGYTFSPLDGGGNLISNTQGLVTIQVTAFPGTTNPSGLISLPGLIFQAQPQQANKATTITFSQSGGANTVFTSSTFGGATGGPASIPFTPNNLTVTVVNHAPTVAPTTITVNEGDSPTPFAITATDSDGDQVTLSLANGGTAASKLNAVFTGGAGAGSASGSLTIPTLAFGSNGTYNLTVTATDNKGASTSQVITVTVNYSDRAPTFNSTPAPTPMLEGATQSVTISASDLDLARTDGVTRGLTYSLSFTSSNTKNTPASTAFISPQSGPLTISGTTGTATINLTPGNQDAGVYQVTVLVNDNDSTGPAGPNSGPKTATQTFTVTVNNKLPVVTVLPVAPATTLPVATDENTPVTFTASADTGIGGNNRFTLTAQFTKLTGNNPGTAPGSIPCTISPTTNSNPSQPATAVITCTPLTTNNDYGTYSVVVTATENSPSGTQGGNSANSGTVGFLTVNYLNRVPTFSPAPAPVTISEGGFTVVTLTLNDADLARNDGFTRLPTFNFSITSANTKRAPANTSFIAPQSGPLGVNTTAGTASFNFNVSPGNLDAGVYTVTATVNDNDNTGPLGPNSGPKTSAPAVFTVTVNNVLPVVKVTPTLPATTLPVTIDENGGPVSFNVSADTGIGGNDQFTLSAQFTKLTGANAGSAPAAIPCTFTPAGNPGPTNPVTGVITCTPLISNNDYGTYSVTVTATGTTPSVPGGNSSNSGPVPILTVNYVDRAPTLTQPGSIVMSEGASQSFTLTANDLDLTRGDGLTRGLTYSLSITSAQTKPPAPSTSFISPQSGAMTINGANGTAIINLTPGNTSAGVYTITATVNDNDNTGPKGANSGPKTVVSQTFTVTVNNVLPVVTVKPVAPATTLPVAFDESAGAINFNVSADTGIGGNDQFTLTAQFVKLTGPNAGSAPAAIPCVFTPSPTSPGPTNPATGIITCTPLISNNDYGTYSVTVTATGNDPTAPGGNSSNSGPVAFLTVNYVDRAPTLTQPASITMFESATQSVTLAANDLDLTRGDGVTRGLTYSLNITTANTELGAPSTAFISPQSGNMTISGNNGSATISITPGNRAAGVYTVQVTINDNDNTGPIGPNSGPKTVVKTFTITVNNVLPVITVTQATPTPPPVPAVPPQEAVDENGVATFRVSADTGFGANNIIVFSAQFFKLTGPGANPTVPVVKPCTLTQDPVNPDQNKPATGLISCAPLISNNDYGTYNVTITATDVDPGNDPPNTQGGISTTTTFGSLANPLLTVYFVDQGPTATLTAPTAIREDGSEVLTLTDTDLDLARNDGVTRAPTYQITICATNTERPMPIPGVTGAQTNSSYFTAFSVQEDGHVVTPGTIAACVTNGVNGLAGIISGPMPVNTTAGTATVHLNVNPDTLSAGNYAISALVMDNDNTGPKDPNNPNVSGPKTASTGAPVVLTINNKPPTFDSTTFPAPGTAQATVAENSTLTIKIKANDPGDVVAGKSLLILCAQMTNAIDPTTHGAIAQPAAPLNCLSIPGPAAQGRGVIGRTVRGGSSTRITTGMKGTRITPEDSNSPGFASFMAQTDNGDGTITLTFTPNFSADNAYWVNVTAQEIRINDRKTLIPETVPAAGSHTIFQPFLLNVPDSNRALNNLTLNPNSTATAQITNNAAGGTIATGSFQETLLDGTGNPASCSLAPPGTNKTFTFTITDPDADNNLTFSLAPDPALPTAIGAASLRFVKIVPDATTGGPVCKSVPGSQQAICTVGVQINPTVVQGAGARGDYAALRGLNPTDATTTFGPAAFSFQLNVTDNAARDRFHPPGPIGGSFDPTDPNGRTSSKTFLVSGQVTPYNKPPTVNAFTSGTDVVDNTLPGAFRVLVGAPQINLAENRFHLDDANYDLTHTATKQVKADPGTYNVAVSVSDPDLSSGSTTACSQEIRSLVMTVTKNLQPFQPDAAFIKFTPAANNRTGIVTITPRPTVDGSGSIDAGSYQITLTATDNGTPAFTTGNSFSVDVFNTPNFFPIISNPTNFANDRVTNGNDGKVRLAKLVLDPVTGNPALGLNGKAITTTLCDQDHTDASGCTFSPGDQVLILVQPEASSGKQLLTYNYSITLDGGKTFLPLSRPFVGAASGNPLFTTQCQPQVMNGAAIIDDPATQLACLDFLIPPQGNTLTGAVIQIQITETGNTVSGVQFGTRTSTVTSLPFTITQGSGAGSSSPLHNGVTITTGPNPLVFDPTGRTIPTTAFGSGFGSFVSFQGVVALSGSEPVPTTIIIDLSLDGDPANFRTVQVVAVSTPASQSSIPFGFDIPPMLPDGTVVNTTKGALRLTFIRKFGTLSTQTFTGLTIIPRPAGQ